MYTSVSNFCRVSQDLPVCFYLLDITPIITLCKYYSSVIFYRINYHFYRIFNDDGAML
jgi:hypothetical protein